MLLSLYAISLMTAQSGNAPIWCPNGIADDSDVHVAFRGTFTNKARRCTLRLLGASNYLAWVDGKLVADGPSRFAKEFPEYQTVPLLLAAGRHTIAVHVHNEGVTTRILGAMPPFLWCQALSGNTVESIHWKCARIPGYSPRTRRISDILGWIDWFDTTQSWRAWEKSEFDDSRWAEPVAFNPGIGPIAAQQTDPVRMNPLLIRPIAGGTFTENFGYERDDPATRFMLADLDPKGVPAQGVWRRYDLGRVRLGRPKLILDLPRGSVVEYALCEQLRHGRAHAWITLSGSPTCNFDHFVARGGPQEFMPFTPKGGRYLEAHVRFPSGVTSTSTSSLKRNKNQRPVILSAGEGSPPPPTSLEFGESKSLETPDRQSPIFLQEQFLERTYYGEPEGDFHTDDPLLNQIWKTGVDTLRACAEDALIDCPTRERGEWTGDVASVATDICGVAYSDLGLSRRSLVQAAQAARGDGLVAGVGPSDPGYLSTYAAQWVTACVHYWELTGDKALLQELFPAAERNMAAFEARRGPDGVRDDLGWAFVDWGYVRNDGPSDMALNIHYLRALRSMARWCRAVEQDAKADKYESYASSLETLVKSWLKGRLQQPGGWANVGYHRAALSLLAGLVEKKDEKACTQAIESHLLRCFPNDSQGPRLSDPSVSNDRLMTPYFCHFAFTALLEHRETDFVLNQYRKCWGWALGDGRTTWLEVFDTRWSQCHEWSGCPTWQLSRYVLGLRPRFDLGGSFSK